MRTILGSEYEGEPTLDCMLPQCETCPLRDVGLEAVPNGYPVDARLDESREQPGNLQVIRGSLTHLEVRALEKALADKKLGVCIKP